ncbi:hypothetical protein D3C80_1623460 [compost metagenome]
MAHGGQEQGLGFVGGVGRLARLFQRRFDLPARTDVAERAEQHVFAFVAGRCAAQVQVTAIGAVEVVGQARRVGIEGVVNPAGAQLLATLAQPLLCEGVFQNDLAIAAPQHAQRYRRGLDHVAAEQLAFHQGLYAVEGRGNEAVLQTPGQQADQADT